MTCTKECPTCHTRKPMTEFQHYRKIRMRCNECRAAMAVSRKEPKKCPSCKRYRPHSSFLQRGRPRITCEDCRIGRRVRESAAIDDSTVILRALKAWR
jgi:hypothetical protein